MIPTVAALGSTLALGLACGLNLYATILALGLASRLGWGTIPLPPQLRGLEHPLLIITAILLAAIEVAIERLPLLASAWASIHALAKPAIAALLALPFLDALQPGLSSAGRGTIAIAGAAIAFAAHASRATLLASVEPRRTTRHEVALHLAYTAVALTLALSFRTRPRIALPIAAATLVWVAAFGPRAWRLFHLAIRAQFARAHALLRPRRWSSEHELPRRLRGLLPPPAPGDPPRVLARAALRGVPSVPDYHDGWIVLAPGTADFLYRSHLRGHRASLGPLHGGRIAPGPWLDAVELHADSGPFTLFLLKESPPPDLDLFCLEPGPYAP